MFHNWVNVKWQKMEDNSNNNHNTGMDILMLGKMNFKRKNITKDKEWHFITIKNSLRKYIH